MQSDTITVNVYMGGIGFAATVPFTGAGARKWTANWPIPAGIQSTGWTNSTATAILPAGHGITTAQVIDLYWAGGKKLQMAATVVINSVALAGGHGDALPADATAVIVSPRVPLAIGFTGNDLLGYAFGSNQRTAFDCLDGSSVSQQVIEILVPPMPNVFGPGIGSNVFAGFFQHADCR